MDIVDFLRYAAALAFVLALILALAWVMRRTGLDGRFGGGPTALSKKSTRRLAVIETMMLDNRRRLVLFRRAMPDVTIVPNPVFPESVSVENWWREPGTLALIASEYRKYLVSLVWPF